MILVKFFERIARFWWVKERMSDLLRKHEQFTYLLIYHERPERIAHGHSFVMSDLSNLLTDALLTWATWAIRSQSLFWHERPEWFAHSRSFVLSDLSELLTVAHLIWVIWANNQMTDEQMSEFPTLGLAQYSRYCIGDSSVGLRLGSVGIGDSSVGTRFSLVGFW